MAAPAHRFRQIALSLVMVAGAGACDAATDVELLEISASGALVGQVYVDLNGSGEADGGDEPMSGVTVLLSSAAGGTPIAEAETDADGVFLFEDVPVGSYGVALDPDVLGDSLVDVEGAGAVEVVLGEPVEAILGVSFPELTIEEVRAADAGRRVFTTGIALNPRQSFSLGQVFLKGESAYLQAVDVGREPAVVVGDSVRFLGRTTVVDGRPALADVTPIIIVRQAQVPVPVEVSTLAAAGAEGGSLDAALVRIAGAEVSGGENVGNDFHFTADDGSGPLEVILRYFLGFGARPTDGDTIAVATGMLEPHDDGSGNVRWRIVVRAASELVLEP